jgi:hypothetical protein
MLLQNQWIGAGGHPLICKKSLKLQTMKFCNLENVIEIDREFLM